MHMGRTPLQRALQCGKARFRWAKCTGSTQGLPGVKLTINACVTCAAIAALCPPCVARVKLTHNGCTSESLFFEIPRCPASPFIPSTPAAKARKILTAVDLFLSSPGILSYGLGPSRY